MSVPPTGITTETGLKNGPPRLGRQYLVVLILSLALYIISMAPGSLWQDSGLAQVRVLRLDLVGERGLALSHPLYYILAIAFQILPFTESAVKTNLVSAVFGAITVANVYLFVYLLTKRRDGAAIGALALAVAHTFWQHCALAEVYTVSTALLSTELLCIYHFTSTGNPRWLALLFLLNGLGISNHMLAVLSLACYGPWLLWLLWRGKIRPATLTILIPVWLAGASLYLALIAGQLVEGHAWSTTIRSALFGNTLFGNNYADKVLNVLPGRRQLVNSVLYLGLNFPTPGVLLVIPGLAALWKLRQPALRIMLTALLAIHLLWAIRYDVPDQYTFFIPSLVMLSVVFGLGAARFLANRSTRWRITVAIATLLPALVYIPLPWMARAAGLNLGLIRQVPYRDGYDYFLRPWKTGYHGPERFAREVCETLPPGAVLIADSTTVRPVHYAQLTGRWRDDLKVFPPVSHRGDIAACRRPADLAFELDAGLVYVVTPLTQYCPAWLTEGYQFTRDGLVYRVTGPRKLYAGGVRSADHSEQAR